MILSTKKAITAPVTTSGTSMQGSDRIHTSASCSISSDMPLSVKTCKSGKRLASSSKNASSGGLLFGKPTVTQGTRL
eukprot:790690-Amphidinium_carterae.1